VPSDDDRALVEGLLAGGTATGVEDDDGEVL
jgi:hypothetical protein